MINRNAELMISCQKENMMCTGSKQTHRVQQQDHHRIRLMEAMEEDLEDEAMEEDLDEEGGFVKFMHQSLVITPEL